MTFLINGEAKPTHISHNLHFGLNRLFPGGAILKGKSQELSVDFCRNKICLSYSRDLTTVFSKPVTRGNFMIRFHKRGEILSRLITRVTVGASLRAWESMAGNS